MWKVVRCVRDYEDVWRHTESEHETEQEAEDECNRLHSSGAAFQDWFEVEEDQ